MSSSEAVPAPEHEPHRQRRAAESFGSDPERYDRARPRWSFTMDHLTFVIAAVRRT
jgi:hypothetical protein